MSETSGTNKINNNKSELLFKKKNLTEQQQNQQAPQTLPRVYMIKVLDKKKEIKEQNNQDFNTILIGGNLENNNLNLKKMKNKLNNSLVIEDMDEQQTLPSQLNTTRNNDTAANSMQQINLLTQNKSKKLINTAESFSNRSLDSVGVGSSSSTLSLSTNSFFKENSVVQVNDKLLNRGIQTDQNSNGITGVSNDLINKSGSNILLLSMSHSSSLNSSRVTSSADLSLKQSNKLK